MTIKLQKSWLLPNGKYQCPHCKKEYAKKGICSHIWRAHGDGQNFTANNDGYKNGTKQIWNKGLTAKDNESIARGIYTRKQNYSIGKFKAGGNYGKHHSEAISRGMKKAHAEGRAHNIGLCRWNNKMSYPEKFFAKVIKNEFDDKNYTNEFPIGIYSIDFAWVDKKLAIEIDGDQHEKPDYKARDQRKDKKLHSEGWKVLRIKWKDLFNNTKKWIKIAKEFIHEKN